MWGDAAHKREYTGRQSVPLHTDRERGENVRTPLTWMLVGWLLSCSAPATAQDSQIERATLAGLKPISVEVEGLASIAEKNGLTGAAIQADTERRLRQAGIPVTSDADAYLYVNVTVADPGHRRRCRMW